MADSIITTLRLIGHRSYISGMDSAARSVNRLERANDDASGGLNLFQSRLGGVRGALGLVSAAAKGTGLVIGALGIYIGKTGIEFNAKMEQTKIGMETLLGSSKTTEKVFKSVQNYALKSPLLSVADAMQSTQQMLGAGMNADRATSTIGAFSNVLSAMGRGPEDLKRLTYAFSQMLSKGQISAEELRGQLGEIFPASRLLADKLGMSTSQLSDEMKSGSLKGKKYVYALLDAINAKYKGATARQATTFTGMLTNIQENIKYTAGLLTEQLFGALKDKVLPAVADVQKKVQNWAKGGGPKRVVSAVKTGFKTGDTSSVEGYKGVEGAMGKAAAIAGKVVPKIVDVAKQFWAALQPMKPFITNVLMPFAIGFAKGLIAGIIGLIPLIKIAATVLGWIGEKAKPIKGIIEGIGFAIGFVFGPGKIGIFRIFGRMFGVIGSAVGRVWSWLIRVSGAANKVVGAFLGLGIKVAGVISRMLGRFMGIPGKLVSLGGKIVKVIIKGLGKLGSAIGAVLSDAVGAVTSAAVNLGGAIWDGIKSGIMNLVPDKVKDVVSSVLGLSSGPSNRNQGPGAAAAGRPSRRRAHGGLASGPTLVGERGPELLHVAGPGMVSPLSLAGATPDLSQAVRFQVVAPIYLDQRQIGQAVIDDQSDRQARK